MPRKPPDREVKLDTYEVEVNGEVYHPHEGESVWLEPLDSVDQALEVSQMARFKTKIEAIQGDPDAEIAAVGIMRELLDDVAAFLAAHATRWTVTDARSRDLPPPDGTAETVNKLGKGLLLFIFGAIVGAESAVARKNA